MRTAWIAAIALASLLAGCGTESPAPDRSGKAATPGEGPAVLPVPGRDGTGVLELLPGEAREVLETADDLELLALHPYPLDADEAGATWFHDYKILGRASVPAEGRRALVKALYAGLNENNDTAASCFNPRHGLRATKGERTLDIVICFECLQVNAYGPVTGERHSGLLSESPEPAFDAMLRTLRLPKHVDK